MHYEPSDYEKGFEIGILITPYLTGEGNSAAAFGGYGRFESCNIFIETVLHGILVITHENVTKPLSFTNGCVVVIHSNCTCISKGDSVESVTGDSIMAQTEYDDGDSENPNTFTFKMYTPG